MSVRSALARHRLPVTFVAGVLASAAVVGASVAVAGIPSTSTGEITACVAKKTGAVRVIDYQAGKRCKASESKLDWSRGYTYRGTWAASTSYAVGDVVVHRGSSYVARRASKGAVPDTGTAWGVLAARGATGPAGGGQLPRATFRSSPTNTYFTLNNGLHKVLHWHLPAGNWVVVASFSVGAHGLQAQVIPSFHVYCELHNTSDGYAGGADAIMDSDPSGSAATSMTINAGTVSTGATGQDESLYCRGEALGVGNGSNGFMWVSVNQLMTVEVGNYV